MTQTLVEKLAALKSQSGRSSVWNSALNAAIEIVRQHEAEQRAAKLLCPNQWWICPACECQHESKKDASACNHAEPKGRIWKALRDPAVNEQPKEPSAEAVERVAMALAAHAWEYGKADTVQENVGLYVAENVGQYRGEARAAVAAMADRNAHTSPEEVPTKESACHPSPAASELVGAHFAAGVAVALAEEAFKKVGHALGLQAAGINDNRTCTLAAREALAHLPALKPQSAAGEALEVDEDPGGWHAREEQLEAIRNGSALEAKPVASGTRRYDAHNAYFATMPTAQPEQTTVPTRAELLSTAFDSIWKRATLGMTRHAAETAADASVAALLERFEIRRKP